MGFATFSGPLRLGTQRYGATDNTGLVMLTQSFDTGNLANPTVIGNYDALLGYLPAGSQIVNILVDQVVAVAGGATMTISVGSTSGGAELMAGVSTGAGGRFTGVATAATQLAWQTSTTADTAVFVRNAITAASATAGRAIVTVVYIQRASNGAQAPTVFEN
jgi:hypothetical protein